MRIAVLISGHGSNLQALIDAVNSKKLDAKIELVLSSNSKALGLERAKKAKIPNFSLPLKNRDNFILEKLAEHKIELVILAGYLKKISAEILEKYRGRVINIHPSLLPKFGGKGMYGMNVHQAVIEAGEKKSGATVHLVTGDYDQGPILAQREVLIEKQDTAEILAAKVLKIEHQLFIDAISKFLSNLRKK